MLHLDVVKSDIKMKKINLRILAIDPGLTNTGWVLMECNPTDETLTILKLGEFHPGPTADRAENREPVNEFSKRTISLKLLREKMNAILLDVQPDYVVAEGIFFNPLRPQAHEALAMWHCVVRLACMDMLKKKLEVVPTKIAKKILTGSGGNGKLTVQQSIVMCKEISFKNEALKRTMSEHCADAIAVGYAFMKSNREQMLLQLGIVKHSK